jgi:hypothetical protein
MTEPVGACFAGGFEQFVINDESGEEYTILFLPDRQNYQLQREGKAPVFYYLPEQVRLARKGDTGHYKFHHTHFVGILDDSVVGVDPENKGEVQGGVFAFTVTSRFPTSVIKQAHEMILDKFSGRDDKYWGIRTRSSPDIRIAQINSNVTCISNIAPNSEGSTPQEAASGGSAATGGGSAPSGGGDAPGDSGGGEPREGFRSPGHGALERAAMPGVNPFKAVPHGRGFRAPTALDPWVWKMDGQGPGSITGGENAYAGLIGPIPSEIIWAGFHGAYSPIVAVQNLQLPMWSQLMRIKITGKWQRIFDHFSANANARYMWFSADIKTEFNRMRQSGDIKVEIDIDGTAPGADEVEREINKRIDTIVDQFLKIAKKVIFDPPTPEVKPAEAPSGGIFSGLFGGGGGLALKSRHDRTYVDLKYEETRYFRYIQPHTISSSLEGFYDEIKADPENEKRYFTRLVLGGLGRKVTRMVKGVANYPEPAKGSTGDPVAFMSAQIGYPDTRGAIVWKPDMFQASDPTDKVFKPQFVMRQTSEVQNPPTGWKPDVTFVKRKVHFLEPPAEADSPYERVFVEQNVVELDAEPSGTPTNDNILDVRADHVGVLDVGSIGLSAELTSSGEVVEVEFQAKGTRSDGTDRANQSTRFRWTFTDQNEPRRWRIFTGQPDFKPEYQYRVHVTVKGTIFKQGQAWTGPWEDVIGNGPLMVDVPPPDAEGVTARDLTSSEIAFVESVRAVDSPPEDDVAPAVEAPQPSDADEVIPLEPRPADEISAPTTDAPSAPRDSAEASSESDIEDRKVSTGTKETTAPRETDATATDEELGEGWVEVLPTESRGGAIVEDENGWVEVPPSDK